jgi:hypothetical protein
MARRAPSCGRQIRPLSWAIDKGRIVCLSGKRLLGFGLKTGGELWNVPAEPPAPRTLVIAGDVVVMQGGKSVAACDATNGKRSGIRPPADCRRRRR